MGTAKGAGLGITLLIVVSLVTPLKAQRPGTVAGSITTDTGNPLSNTNVALLDAFLGSTSNLEGYYEFNAPPGTYTLQVSHTGYETAEVSITITEGQVIRANFILSESIAEFGDVVVVVGSRSTRTAIETPVPIDVITAEAVEELGVSEINQALHYLAPSFNSSHQTISDGTDHINPASLRGLGPDQVLVLINGKRRHTSSLVHVNGTFGRGTVGVDLNAIPRSAIERIEVLRDGASAQYGSDALAGVINIVLKERTNDIKIDVGSGITGEGDGEMVQASANYGFSIGDYGFFNITGEFLDRSRTNRSAPWAGDIFPGISGTNETNAELNRRGMTREDFSMKTGQGNATMGSIFFNSSVPLGGLAEFYALGGVSHRNGDATGFFRLPNSEPRVNLNVYPNGFLPEIHSIIQDQSITAGLKGIRNDWVIDLSATHGGNAFNYNIENSINASLGEASPTSFDAGTLYFRQTTGNLDLVRDLDTQGYVNSLSLALGSEFRVENYEIEAGQTESWQLGNGGTRPGLDFDTTSTGNPKSPGSQVFPGFQPSNEVDRYRYSLSTYAELESEINDFLFVSAAGRFENYSDFGQTLNGKLALRYALLPEVALRGAISTGFRAPSLHQLWFNNVSTQFVLDPATGALAPSQVLTATNASAITSAFGIPNLQEETSINLSAGFTTRPLENLSFTADYYRITIDDRIVLSSRFSDGDGQIGDQVAEILAPFQSSGVRSVQFFANAVDTRTQGLDLVAAYDTQLGSNRLILTTAVNLSETRVRSVNVPQTLADRFEFGDQESVQNTLFNREERNRLEDALPRQKGFMSAQLFLGNLSVMARANYFGSIEYKPTNPDNDETFDAKTLLDLSLGYELTPDIELVVGGNNILNTFPDKHQKEANLSNGRFLYSRRVTQFGMNGGFYYARLSLNL